MIKILGPRRIMMLAVMIVINTILAGAVYAYFQPESKKVERTLRSTKSQVTQKRADAQKLRTEYDQIEKQKADFKTLEALGFFSDQNRIVARERIEQIQKFTHILEAKYEISPARIEETEQVKKAGQVILNSLGEISLDALDDMDIYNFVYWIENAFPGHVSINNLRVERKYDINEATVRQIGSGRPVKMVQGQLGFSWRTLLPQERVGDYLQRQ